MRELGRRRIVVYDGPYKGLHPAWGLLASLAFILPGALALAALALLEYGPPEFARLLPREAANPRLLLAAGGGALLVAGSACAVFCLAQWRRGSLPGSDNQGRMLVRAIVETVVMSLFIVPANLVGFLGGRDLLGLAFVALIFDGFLLWALSRSFAKLRGFLRFGEARLELGAAPASLGGTVEGRLGITRNAGELRELKAVLRRVEIGWVRREDSDGRTHREPVFVETHAEERTLGPGEAPSAGLGVELRFQLPARVEPPPEDFAAQWELLIHARGEGVEYRSAFRIPVEEDAGRPEVSR